AFRRSLEPFLGGGAVFFHLAPRRAVLSDANAELVNAYKYLREHAEEIEHCLARLQARHNADLYYRIRDTQPTDPFDQAVRFIYLNRTCFNGIYRVNRKGAFNVPIGSKDLVEYHKGYLQKISA